MFSSKTLISFRLKKDIDILDDMGVSKLSAKVFLKVNSFNTFIQQGCIKFDSKDIYNVTKHFYFKYMLLRSLPPKY